MTHSFTVRGRCRSSRIGANAYAAPSVWALNDYSNIFGLNESFMTSINQRAEDCGYFDFMEKALTFPPAGKLPTAPNSSLPGCAVWDDIIAAAVYVNPCFNIYHLVSLLTGPADGDP